MATRLMWEGIAPDGVRFNLHAEDRDCARLGCIEDAASAFIGWALTRAFAVMFHCFWAQVAQVALLQRIAAHDDLLLDCGGVA